MFRENHTKELEVLSKKMKQQLTQNVEFWEGCILDEYGYVSCIDRYGRKYDDTRSGWFFGRNLYTFSYLAKEFKFSTETLARVGRNYLDTSFYAGNGRFNKYLNKYGEVVEGSTNIFTDHFAIKGLYEYIYAFDKKDDLKFAEELSETLFKNVTDLAILNNEGVTKECKKHSVNFMTMLVAMESEKLWGDKYAEIVNNAINSTLYDFAKDEHQAQFEYINTDGSLVGKSRVVDIGHSFESLWFAMEWGNKYNQSYVRRAEVILDWIIERGFDKEYGGFVQNVDVYNSCPEEDFKSSIYINHKINWDDKIWWVQAEALLALAHSALLNENECHYKHFIDLYEYIEIYFRDKEYGEWFSFCKRDGEIISDNKGFELKGPYHVTRCLAKIIKLIDEYISTL